MRAARRINRKTGQEEPLRTREQILDDIQNRLHRRLRFGAPMVENEELIVIMEALELLFHEPDGDKERSSGTEGTEDR